MRDLQTPDGTSLAFNDRGKGKPFVFVHGWTLNQEMWDHHVHHLSKEFRCVTFDRRGHGRSDMSAGGYDANTLADDLAALLEHLDLYDITLVSHSMGSVDIMRYLSRHGSRRVSTVLMIAPSSPMSAWAEENPEGLLPKHVEAAKDGLAHDRAFWFDSQKDAYFTLPEQAGRTSQAMVEATVRQCLETPLAVQLACLETMLTTDMRHDFASVDVPTTIVHGGLDQSTPLATCGMPAAALLPHGDLHVYEEAGHGIYISHRAEIEAELRLAASVVESAF